DWFKSMTPINRYFSAYFQFIKEICLGLPRTVVMLTFFFFGRAIEPLFVARIGYLGFLIFYLLGIVIAILPSYIQNRRNSRYASLGASGAVSAVVFVFILLAPWSLIYVFIIPVPAILFAAGYVFYSV